MRKCSSILQEFVAIVIVFFAFVFQVELLMFAQRRFRARRTRSTVRRTAEFIGGDVCRRRCCATVGGTACRERTSSRVDRARATRESSRVRTASVFHNDGFVTATMTAETSPMNRPTAVRYLLISLYGRLYFRQKPPVNSTCNIAKYR